MTIITNHYPTKVSPSFESFFFSPGRESFEQIDFSSSVFERLLLVKTSSGSHLSDSLCSLSLRDVFQFSFSCFLRLYGTREREKASRSKGERKKERSDECEDKSEGNRGIVVARRDQRMMGREFHSGQSGEGARAGRDQLLVHRGEKRERKKKKEVKSPLQSLFWSVRILFLSRQPSNSPESPLDPYFPPQTRLNKSQTIV